MSVVVRAVDVGVSAVGMTVFYMEFVEVLDLFGLFAIAMAVISVKVGSDTIDVVTHYFIL